MAVKLFSCALLLVCAMACNAATLYLIGDSTMAKGGGGPDTDGWGQYLQPYLSIPVVNKAIAGRSARSYTAEGRFDTLYTTVKKGDWAIIEFGHNDGFASPDNGRGDCPGSDVTTTCTIVDNTGKTIVTHTYNYYIQNAVTKFASLGVKTVVSSPTPINGSFASGAGDRFVGDASLAASRTGADYVDHFDYVIEFYKALGQAKVSTFYPHDHTHTSPAGATVVAQAFVKGLNCGKSALKSSLTSAAKSLPNGCM
ncbi:SGNH hydrolase [Rickenella mellea]|uniref:SGNH hydrolase n=1 Tax=Rickenella mellea TaxID=50990 RepID=A0A4Y7Q267_9AGAM|nr:SGNH hydrolase [Rickenella mellea]